MTSEEFTLLNSITTAINNYATAMEMAAWSQATATTNAGNLATAITAAFTAFNASDASEGRLP